MKQLIKRIIYFFLGPLLKLCLTIRTSKRRNTKYYFALCAIFKNEAKYFCEWIEYHKLLGVDHIYLYNNFSTDNYEAVLESYIKDDFITLIEWPVDKGQISAYENCFNNYRKDTHWLMFLDLDEFICPKYETDIKTWIRKYEKYPSVIIYWLMFGTNGIIDYEPNKLVIEQYTNCWESVRNVGKIVLNTNFEPIKMYFHHIFCKYNLLGMKIKIPMVNEFFRFIYFPGTEICPPNGTIQINHYWSKCLTEYVKKQDRGDAFSLKHEQNRKVLSFFYWHEHQNISDDKVIWRFLMDLKIRMNSIEVKFKD